MFMRKWCVLAGIVCGSLLLSGCQGKPVAGKADADRKSVKQESTASDEFSYDDTYDGENLGNEVSDGRVLSNDAGLEVQIGDTVFIDYVGTIDGVPFDGGDTQGMGTDLTIGSGMYIDGFEDQLVGSHPGDEVVVKVTFPDDYGVDELNGKEALFTVQVHGVYQMDIFGDDPSGAIETPVESNVDANGSVDEPNEGTAE